LRYDNFEALKKDCLNCEKCPLFETRTNVVVGVGNENADIMFVGEGPGENEDLQGEPFVGKAGQLLDKYLEVIGLSRKKNVYIANIVKCRPPFNRDPSDEEQDACLPYLINQLKLIQPKVIVCLGRVAAKRLINPDYKITREHGSWFCQDGVWITSIYHPSALLRDVSKRPETFDDLLSIRKKLKEVHADF
jgi:DNA polymerase